jgi:O-antigen ligase
MDNSIAFTQGEGLKKKMPWLLFGVFNVLIIGIAITEANWHYLAAVIAPYLIYFSMKNPLIFPFGLYVLLIPFDRLLGVIGFAQGSTLTKLFGVLTILVLTLKGSFEKKFTEPRIASLVFMLFVAYCLLTYSWAIEPGAALSKMPTLIGLFIFYLIVSAYKIREEDFNTLKWCILIGGILAAVLTFNSFQSGMGYGHTQRATIMVQEGKINPNFLSLSLLIPLSICVQMMLTSPKKAYKIFFLCIFLFITYAIIITGSRKSLVGVAIIISLYSIHIQNKISFSVIAFIGFAVILAIVPDYFTARIGSSIQDRGSGRLDIWIVGLEALKRYWVLGAGLGNFPLAFNEFINEGGGAFKGYSRDAHNVYLMVIVETGVIGFSLLLWTFKKHYKLLVSRLVRNDLNIVMLRASFWSMLAAGFFANIFLEKSFWLMLMMIVMYRNVISGMSTAALMRQPGG